MPQTLDYNAAIDKLRSLPEDRQRAILAKMSPEEKSGIIAALKPKQAPLPVAASKTSAAPPSADTYKPWMAPLDVGIGIEQSLGIDPMHPISSLPQAAGGFVKSVEGLFTSPMESAKAILSAPVKAVQRGGQAIREGDPEGMFQAVGAGYTAAEPVAEGAAAIKESSIAALREASSRLSVPEKLKTRAAANRVPLPSAGLPTWGKRAAMYEGAKALGFPGVGEAAVALDFARRWQPYRNLKATVQEGLADRLAVKPSEFGGEIAEPEDTSPIESGKGPIVNRAGAAADEEARLREARRREHEAEPAEEEPYTPPETKPPSTPGFLRDQLERLRQDETPQELYDRQQKQRNQEFTPAEEEPSKVGAQRPETPQWLIDEVKSAKPGAALNEPIVNKWMGVSPQEVKFGAHPGQQLIDEGLISDTKEATHQNVSKALQDSGEKMQERLQEAGKEGVRIDARKVVNKAVKDAQSGLLRPSDSEFVRSLETLENRIVERYPDTGNLTPAQAHALKKELGDAAKWNGVGYDEPVNQAVLQMYRDLNDSIKKEVPGIAAEQGRWQNLYVAARNIEDSMLENQVGKGSGSVPGTKFDPAKFAPRPSIGELRDKAKP